MNKLDIIALRLYLAIHRPKPHFGFIVNEPDKTILLVDIKRRIPDTYTSLFE